MSFVKSQNNKKKTQPRLKLEEQLNVIRSNLENLKKQKQKMDALPKTLEEYKLMYVQKELDEDFKNTPPPTKESDKLLAIKVEEQAAEIKAQKNKHDFNQNEITGLSQKLEKQGVENRMLQKDVEEKTKEIQELKNKLNAQNMEAEKEKRDLTIKLEDEISRLKQEAEKMAEEMEEWRNWKMEKSKHVESMSEKE
mmetsp:Transcript_1959/g.2468  ORF Transcript_1959/g.2468 Transcript_1959/m.2468 type:complete len:195 (+) Transcript_1959:104-688(+)